MKPETLRTAAGFFGVIFAGAILSAVAGGAFGGLVAAVSPEFVADLFGRGTESGIARYAFAVGMIWGVFIGAAASGFACLLAAIIQILKIRFDSRKSAQGVGSPAGRG